MVSRARYAMASSFETQKIVMGRPVHVCQRPLSKKVVATLCPLHSDTKSEQLTNPVLAKNLEHLHQRLCSLRASAAFCRHTWRFINLLIIIITIIIINKIV